MVLIPKDRFLKSRLTSSGVASHLTTPSEEETDRLPDCATRRLACLSTIGAWQSQSHPMFRGPSWVNHSCVPLCFFRPKASEPRRARGRSTLPAPLPDWPRRTSEELLIACRRRSVLPSPSAPFLPLPAFRWRRGLPSRSPFDNAPRRPSRGSEKLVHKPVDNGDIGNNRRNIVTIAIRDSRDSLSVRLRAPDSARTRASRRARPSSRFARPPGSAPAARSSRDRRASRSGRRSGRGKSASLV